MYINIFCFLLLIFSFYKDKEKTKKVIRVFKNKLISISIPFAVMLILVAIVLYFIPDELIVKYIASDNKIKNNIIAFLFGSISAMPGFIAFPLGKVLIDKSVEYSTVSIFTTSLMLIGVISFPLERHYLNLTSVILRNLISIILVFLISLFVALFYGELIL